MFNWLRRWRQNRTRAIFKYWDGERDRLADPIVIFRAIKAHEKFNVEKHPMLHDAGDDEATMICVEAARDIFGIKPIEEGGLTETESVDVLGSYFDWIAAIKKNISTPPILPVPSDSPPFCGMGPGNRSADSFSTSAEPSCAAPTL